MEIDMRRIAFAAVPLLAMSLSACAGKPMRTGGPLPPTQQTCEAEAGRVAIGEQATPERVEQIRQQTHSRVARVLHPGTLVTMEFSGDRVNIRVDAQNVILGVTCG
jgi:hypothetical protein